MNPWIFVLYFGLSSNMMLFISLFKLFRWPLEAFSVCSCVPHPCRCVCACVCLGIPYFLTLQGTPGSSDIFPAPALELDFFLWISGSFFGESGWWVSSLLLNVTPFGSSQQSLEIYVCRVTPLNVFNHMLPKLPSI